MTAQALINCTAWVNGVDLTTDSNMWSAKESCAKLDFTPFTPVGDGKTRVMAGLRTVEGTWSGFGNFASGQSAATLRPLFASVDNHVCFTPNGTANDRAVFYKGLVGDFEVGGKVGDVGPFVINLAGTNTEGECEGFLILPKSTCSSNSNGTAYQDGAVTTTLYGLLNVFSVSGTSTPTLNMKIQSSPTGSGSWTDRITFTAATAIGSAFSSATGAITDTYWRALWTVSGTSPVFSAAVAWAAD